MYTCIYKRFWSCLGCSRRQSAIYFFPHPYTISIHLPPSPSKLGRQSCWVACRYLCSSPPRPYVVVTCEEWCRYSRRGWFVLAPIRTRALSHEENCLSFGGLSLWYPVVTKVHVIVQKYNICPLAIAKKHIYFHENMKLFRSLIELFFLFKYFLRNWNTVTRIVAFSVFLNSERLFHGIYGFFSSSNSFHCRLFLLKNSLFISCRVIESSLLSITVKRTIDKKLDNYFKPLSLYGMKRDKNRLFSFWAEK